MIALTVRMAHIFPHIVQVPSVEGGALEVLARASRVDGVGEHLVPRDPAPCVAHAVVRLARAGNPLRDVGRMRGDLRGDEPLAHVVRVGQPQVLGRRDVAEEIRPRGGRHRPADRGGDVVVAGRDVGDQRPEHVEWCAVAEAFFQLHVGLDLV